ncbi:WD40 repeat domain-containing protein [Arundinibacter roseus]|uniref:WD40 repeat domain-containing protein n=1 Tax=Arundinibacter roseus TaxID=2070510 RepID=A0A4R4KBQ5_9BACT|nr:WD40 repeat domain-containing protein [Arundinibacter roseus]TDB65337.1 WD40 repeat domain-containing protein [Arundinibacter roseus]
MNVRKIDTFSGHRDCVYALISDQRSPIFYSAGGDGQVVRWNVTKPDLGELVARVGASIYALALDPQTGLLWIGHNYEGIQVVDPVQKKIVASIKLGALAIFDIKIQGQKAYIAQGDGILTVVDAPTFSIQKHLKISQKSVRTLAILKTTNELAAGFSDWCVCIFDLTTMSLKKRFQAHDNSVFSAQYSPDGTFLVTAGRDAHLKVWCVEQNYQSIQDIPAHMFSINHITYSGNGALLATASMDKSIKIWDANSFKLLKVVDRARHAGHATSINKLLWMTTENLLVSASDDRMVSVWEFGDN